MKLSYAIIVVVAATLTLLISVAFFVRTGFAAKKNKKVDGSTILNTFPAELADPSRGGDRFPQIILAAMLGIFSFLAYSFTFLGMLVPKDTSTDAFTVSTVFLLLFAIGTGVTLFLATFIPFTHLKPSFAAMISLVFFVVASGLFPMITTTSGTYDFQLNAIVSYIMAGIGASPLLFMANPKQKEWAKLRKTEVNGATFWIKPKINWLALTIWYAYLVNALLVLLLLVSAILNLLG